MSIVTAWIALFAILMAALMPSVSHALAASSHQASWAEVCSTAGMTMVRVSEAQLPVSGMPGMPGMPGKLALHAEHCPFCSLHAGAMDLPPTHAFSLPAVAVLTSFPVLFYHSPALQFIWSSAQSRAPPSIS